MGRSNEKTVICNTEEGPHQNLKTWVCKNCIAGRKEGSAHQPGPEWHHILISYHINTIYIYIFFFFLTISILVIPPGIASADLIHTGELHHSPSNSKADYHPSFPNSLRGRTTSPACTGSRQVCKWRPLLLFNCWVGSDSLWPCRLQHARLPCSSPSSQSLLQLMSIESVMPSNHLIIHHPLLLLPSIFPSIRVFSNESALHIRWPKYWSFSFNIRPTYHM